MTPGSVALRVAREIVESDLDSILDGLAPELQALLGRRLLITGGAGFLGQYLVQLPLRLNQRRSGAARAHVTVCDNFVRGMPPWLREIQGRDDLTVAEHDITRPLPFAAGNFDYIIHAASIASPAYFQLHPIETIDTTVKGLRLLLDRAVEQADRGAPVRGFLFFSSSDIYGEPSADWIPTPESYRGSVSCTGPRACYDESKRFGETLCVNFARHRGVPARIARPFSNYGPGLLADEWRVIPEFASQLVADRDIVMLSDGAPTRTFCYVTDAVAGYYRILLRGRDGEAYNIGTESPEISLAELAERMADMARDMFGYTGRVVRGSAPVPDRLMEGPQRRCPSTEKARRQLGFAPRVSLEEGLRRALIWYAGHAGVLATSQSLDHVGSTAPKAEGLRA